MFGKFSDRQEQIERSNFVLGERLLRAYFAGGNVRYLEDAEASLSEVKPSDRNFEGARFYLGVAKTQLRKTNESIEIFEDLRRRQAGKQAANREFQDQLALQLAYAHIKTYTEEGYKTAEDELNRLERAAEQQRNQRGTLNAKSLKAFLYSVLAGRGADESARSSRAKQAIDLADSILTSVPQTDEAGRALRFEALNALGIAWMRVGQYEWDGYPDRETSWANAQKYYDRALEVVPNSVRSLQNLAQLRLLQARLGGPESKKKVLLEQAAEFVNRSLQVSDQDQFPYDLLTQIALEQGDARKAIEYIRIGRTKPGAVKEKRWAELEQTAIEQLKHAD